MTQFISYNTATGAYPGAIEEMTSEQAERLNKHFRLSGESVRWIMPSCDSCDSRKCVEYVDGQMLCENCRAA